MSLSNPSQSQRRQFLRAGALALGGSVLAASGAQSQSSPTVIVQAPPKKVVFVTDWVAQAEHGGFYQAVAQGLYRKAGLNVNLRAGGPQVIGSRLLASGQANFIMGNSTAQLFETAKGAPFITVAAFFQKDPQVLLAPPNKGINSLADLRGKPIYIADYSLSTFWPFLKAKFGYTDSQKRSFSFNIGPFISDVKAGRITAMQGYATSEPFLIEREGGFIPQSFLLADSGYTSYTTTIQTTTRIVNRDPDLVERFIDASIQGWYNFFEDPSPAIPLIKRDNVNMKEDLIAFGIKKMKELGIVQSGEAQTLGIGAMTDARWKSSFDLFVGAKLLKPNLRYRDAYTLRFINKGAAKFKA